TMATAARLALGRAPRWAAPRLDRRAQQQAERMRDEGSVQHDWGDGGPLARAAIVVPEARRIGENLAFAGSLERSHRVLWASPSHRENLLGPSFTHVGVGVAQDAVGKVWVCELFAEFP